MSQHRSTNWQTGSGIKTLLPSNEKFQKYIDAQAAKATREQSISQQSLNAYDNIINSLELPSLNRYERLRQRCLQLRQINAAIKNPTGSVASLEQMQRADLDRLLWVFLKLLYTEHNIDCFLANSPEDELARKIKQLERATAKGPRAKQSIDENLQICRQRLENYQKARENLDIVRLEIDRLENKISSLGEIAISSQQESEDVSSHVDQVASSILQTEQTINDLHITDVQVSNMNDDPPNLLERETVTNKQYRR